jgi:hypothetical protein
VNGLWRTSTDCVCVVISPSPWGSKWLN